MNWQEYTPAEPQILNGKPVIKGPRLSIEFILEQLSDGWSEQMLLENYPRLSHESLLAVCPFMLQIVKDGLLYLPTYPLKQAS